MAGSTDLTKQVEALLEDPSQTILMAMKLSKNQASWTVAGRRGRLQSKPRILAIGVRRKENTGKQKPKIHIIKPGPQGLELLKSYRLGALTSIELVTSDTTGRSFLLVFDEKSDSSQPQWTTRTVDDRNQLVFLLLKMCKDYLKTLPKVIGLDVVDLALWAKKNAKSLPGGARLTEEGEGEAVGVESESMMAQDSLVSKVEEEDMEALLGTYVIGIDEAEAFSERLKRELGALEAANVHAILESEALVEEVVDSLDEAAGRVEDMENWLNVFNVKLKHMRDDIESIEAQNNMLEMQAKNNKKLLEELETLLESLYIPPQCIRVLSSGSLDEQAMPNTLEAVGWLVDAVKKLEQPQLDENYVNMRAVQEKKAELDSLKNGFVRRATDFIRSFISSTVEAAAKSQRGPPDHRELHRRWSAYTQLIHCLKELDPNVLDNIRRTYIHSLNMLLRREAREFSTDLRASARVSAKTSTAPPFLEQGSAALPPAADSQAASDAFAKMLRAFLPLISEEGLFFQQFLCFSPAADEDEEPMSDEDAAALAAAAEQLFEGIHEDFVAMVEWVFKVDPLRCITLVGHTEAWQQQQQQLQLQHGADAGGCGAVITRKLLLELETRIRQNFFRYVEEANGQIERYDRGVKQAGVLSYVPRFAALAVRMEGLVMGTCRDLVDQAYNKLVSTMFSTLDRIAQIDPKHCDVLLLENHAAFQNSTYDLAGTIPTLRLFYQQSSETYETACTRYIDSVIFGNFDKLFDYLQKIKNLLLTIETEEIPFQIGFSKADLRKVLKSQLTGVDRSLNSMFNKMRKNLTSGDLLPSLWLKCQESFMERYEELEAVVAKCYANEAISPSSREMRDAFNSIVA
ncbi:unnamed protein product [Closterium sp. Yama58-4]|nr:unnamed protein product [Closterium sp. Yama58-4]